MISIDNHSVVNKGQMMIPSMYTDQSPTQNNLQPNPIHDVDTSSTNITDTAFELSHTISH